jgi:hypothetical protein
MRMGWVRFLGLFLVAACCVATPHDGASQPRASDEVGVEPEDGGEATQGTEGDDGGEAALDGDGDGVRAASPGLLAEAERILAAARETTYSHHTHIDERTGRYDVDCSGFVGYLLRRAAPGARRELVAATVHRPLARHFVELVERLPSRDARRWRRIERVADLRPGDLIAWLRPADSHSRDTGHVMVVAGLPAARRGGVDVPIIDASALRHGRGDPRAAGAASGVGRGTIVLETDPAGHPVAFRWAPGAGYHEHVTTIALARAEADAAAGPDTSSPGAAPRHQR